MIILEDIDSSAIGGVTYDKEAKELYVKFINAGRNYKYSNVTNEEFTELCNAESVGSWIAKNIVQSSKLFEEFE